MQETVAFDPGIGNLILDFNTFINDIYSQLMNLHSVSQKRTRFKLYNNKIYSGIENNIAFYHGCLLWAYYIKKENEKAPKDIIGNVFLSLTPEQIKEYDYLIQVNFLENYFDSYERDTSYYIGKKVIIPDLWKKTLELYKNFLELNKGFVNTRKTDDIVLPDTLENRLFTQDIYSVISKAVNEKNLKILFDIPII